MSKEKGLFSKMYILKVFEMCNDMVHVTQYGFCTFYLKYLNSKAADKS